MVPKKNWDPSYLKNTFLEVETQEKLNGELFFENFHSAKKNFHLQTKKGLQTMMFSLSQTKTFEK